MPFEGFNEFVHFQFTAKQSKKYKKRCRMENDQLVIKGKHYSIEDMDKLPKSLKPVNVTSKTNDTVFGYFGELNPLSNFHPAKFSVEGKTFHCSEAVHPVEKGRAV